MPLHILGILAGAGLAVALGARHYRWAVEHNVQLYARRALDRYQNRDWEQARRLYAEALSAAEVLYGKQSPAIVDFVYNLAVAEWHAGRPDRALGLLERAEILANLAPVDMPVHSDVLSWLGYLSRAQGDEARARRAYERLIEVVEVRHGPVHPSLLEPLEALADMAAESMRYDELETVTRRALGLMGAGAGGSFKAGRMQVLHATALIEQHRMDEAEVHARAAIALAATEEGKPMLAAACRTLGEVLVRKGAWDEASAVLTRGLEHAGTLAGQQEQATGCLMHLADLAVVLGRYGRAAELYEQVLSGVEPAQGRGGGACAASSGGPYRSIVRRLPTAAHQRSSMRSEMVLRMLGWLRLRLGDRTGAETAYRRALAVQDASPPERARALDGWGQCLMAQGKYVAARDAFDEAVSLAARAGDISEEVTLRRNTAVALFCAGEMAAAVAAQTDAVKRAEARAGRQSRPAAAARVHLAWLHLAQCAYDSAGSALAGAIDMLDVDGEESGQRGNALLCAGYMQLARGDTECARHLAERAQAIAEAGPPVLERVRVEALSLCSAAARDQDRVHEAEMLARRAIERCEASPEPLPIYRISALSSCAVALAEQGRFADALPMAVRASEDAEQWFGPSHPCLAEPLVALSWSRRGLGQLVQARADAARAVSVVRSSYDRPHRHAGEALEQLALVARAQGDEAQAAVLAADAIAEHAATLGAEHPALARLRMRLAG